jgi:protein gp37
MAADWWWDHTWNVTGGCSHVSPGCQNCYAQQIAGTRKWPFAGSAGVHDGVTDVKGRRRIFNGKLTVAPPTCGSGRSAGPVRSIPSSATERGAWFLSAT